jgi:hypothetical protein
MYSRSACSNVLLEIKGRSIGSEEKRESDFAPFSFGETSSQDDDVITTFLFSRWIFREEDVMHRTRSISAPPSLSCFDNWYTHALMHALYRSETGDGLVASSVI